MHVAIAGLFIGVKCDGPWLIGKAKHSLNSVRGVDPLIATQRFAVGATYLDMEKRLLAFRSLRHDVHATKRVNNVVRSETAKFLEFGTFALFPVDHILG